MRIRRRETGIHRDTGTVSRAAACCRLLTIRLMDRVARLTHRGRQLCRARGGGRCAAAPPRCLSPHAGHGGLEAGTTSRGDVNHSVTTWHVRCTSLDLALHAISNLATCASGGAVLATPTSGANAHAAGQWQAAAQHLAAAGLPAGLGARCGVRRGWIWLRRRVRSWLWLWRLRVPLPTDHATARAAAAAAVTSTSSTVTSVAAVSSSCSAVSARNAGRSLHNVHECA